MAVTREQVLAAYAANPLAELRPSEEAIQYWQNTGLGSFNQTVDAVRAENPALAAQIDMQRTAATPAAANNTAFTEEQNQVIRDYVTANLDNPSAIAAAAAEFGVSLQALAIAVGVTENEVINYFEQAGVTPPPVVAPAPASPAAPPVITAEQIANTPGLGASGIGVVGSNIPNVENTYEKIVSQILGQGLTDKWSGEGFGSAEANARDMAKILSNIGITDINQFGKIQVAADVGVVPVYSYVYKEYIGDNGPVLEMVPELTGYKDVQGNPVDPSLVTENRYTAGDNDYTSYSAPIGTQEVFGNKITGEAVPNTYGERQTGDAFGGTYAGKGNTGYRVQFKDDGTPVFYTSGQSSNTIAGLLENPVLNLAANAAAAYFGGPLGSGALQLAQGKGLDDAAKAALLTYAGSTASDLLGGNTAGFGAQTDASFLAADAAQLASQGLSESAITQVLGASGYASDAAAALAASMAVNGLDVGIMTQQLDALSTNTGLMSQTGSSADLLAADALQLQGQVGNNFPAIEQNLVASGVDPLIAADVSQQITFNPGLTQADLATNLSNSFGNNIYDVNVAQTYPTSVLPGSGGLLSDIPVGSTATTTTPAVTTPTTTTPADATNTTGLTNSQIANLIKAGVSLASITGAASAVGSGGNTTPMQTPTQGVPTYTPEYYNQLQQYYNAYLPQTPRDVVSPLQQWYNSSYGA